MSTTQVSVLVKSHEGGREDITEDSWCQEVIQMRTKWLKLWEWSLNDVWKMTEGMNRDTETVRLILTKYLNKKKAKMVLKIFGVKWKM